MKLNSNRCWHLKIKKSSVQCLELEEVHHGSQNIDANYVVIPFESIPELIKYLKKYEVNK